MKINFYALQQSSNLQLLASQLVEGFITGMHKSPHHGFSVEFAEHRLYNEGESTKHIDWKVFSRTNRLYTRQYEEETNLRCVIAIDCSPSMHYPNNSSNKFKFSVYASAAIIHILHRQRDAVGLSLFSDNVDLLTPIRSTSPHVNNLFNILTQKINEKTHQKNTTNIPNALHEIAKRIHRRSLIIIFSDLFDSHENIDEVFSALQHLKHKKHEVIIFHVSDHLTELNFDFKDRLYEFIDMETQTKIKVNPGEIRHQFTNLLNQFHRKLKLKCGQLKINLVVANSKEDYFEVLQAYLIKRATMN